MGTGSAARPNIAWFHPPGRRRTALLLHLATPLLVLVAGASSASADVVTFNWLLNDIQTFTAPSDGLYQIDAVGAAGADSAALVGGEGGNGAEISGVFDLTAGETLMVAVGGRGGLGNAITGGGGGGGGGGGSFVIAPGNDPWLIAGGGGGGGLIGNGTAGVVTPSGLNGFGGGAGTGGANGHGGTGGTAGGGGGGGFETSGGNGVYPDMSIAGFGGAGYFDLLGGGEGQVSPTGEGGDGGFGGGGGGAADIPGTLAVGAGGGGGGYSGGGGGGPSGGGGGGGGSFISPDGTLIAVGVSAEPGYGQVQIRFGPVSSIPEPGSLGLVGAGLAAVSVIRKRRRR